MKTRILFGIIAVVVVILVLILNGTFIFPLAIAAVICVALFELYRLMGCADCMISMIAGFVYGALTPFLVYYGKNTASTVITFLCFAVMFLELVTRYRSVPWQSVISAAAVTFLVTQSLTRTVSLLQAGRGGLGYVILAIAAACLSDTGAYFTGSLLGRHKLCPNISPNKTTEGFVGGIVFDVIVMVIFAAIYGNVVGVHTRYWWLIPVAIVCAVISVLGDLAASVFKRQVGVKDFGNLIPGHGGMMDRIDSVLFTVPAFYALICITPIFI